MANEAVVRDRLEDPINFNCGDNNSFEKGAFLRLLDGRIATDAALIGAPCAGICAREKVSGDGNTTVSVYRKGIFDVHASLATIIGASCQMAELNDVMQLNAGATAASGAIIIGHALETAADDETFQLYLDL